jgi:hypothetical protein
MTTQRSRHLAAQPRLAYQRGDPRTHAAYPGRPHGRPSRPATSTTTAVQAGTPWASAACAASIPPVPTSRSWTRRASTPTPAIPATQLRAPPPSSTTSPWSDTADAGTHGHRTATADTGQTGRSDARTGLWTHRSCGQTRVEIGFLHRTLDGCGRADEARPASALPGPPRPAEARGHPNGVPVDRACGAWRPMTARWWGQLPARNCLLPRR